MADSTIPNLTAFTGNPSGTEVLETVQSGASVKIPMQKVADLATIVTPLTYAGLTALVGASGVSAYRLYIVTNAVGGTRRLLLKGETSTTFEDTAIDMSTGQVGTYNAGTDVFTVVSSGGIVIQITVANLQTALGGSINPQATYEITDAAQGLIRVAGETTTSISTSAQLLGEWDGSTWTIGGWGSYDLANDVWVGTLVDLGDNLYINVDLTTITLGAGSKNNRFYQDSGNITLGASASYNIFEQLATDIVMGDNCTNNTFKTGCNTFTFGDNFQNTTIESGVVGDIYTATPDYDFLYGNSYPSRIFSDGTTNFHEYWDGTQYVITNLTTLAVINIGGGGLTLDLEVNGTPNGDQTLLNLIEGTNIDITDNGTGGVTITSLSDRYKTTSTSSNSISNGSKTFTVDANLSYIPLQEVLIVFDSSNHMHGTVTSYSGTTLVVNVSKHTGSGTYTSWSINLDGTPVDAITGSGVTNELAYFTGAQTLGSLATATYPSLTELSYVKGVTSAIQTQLNNKINTQVLTCFGLVITTVNDATNYHIGTIAATPSGTDARRAFKPTSAGTITAAALTLEQVTNGSGETVSIYLRNVTDATETLIGTFTSDFGASTTLKTLFTGLSIGLLTTKDYTVRITTPTWVTNPSQWIISVSLQITV